jgi:hypothetical protein
MIVTLAIPLLVRADSDRTWVSGVGDDASSSCSRTAPCRTFQGALAHTNTGGEINCIDPGGFGAVFINKSVTIDGTSCSASILASGVTGITVNITAASDAAKTVRLRGLSINGKDDGVNGIRLVAARRVFIEDMVIDGFDNHGIQVEVTIGNVFVKNTTIRNVEKSGINVESSPNSTAPELWIDRASLLNNFIGLSVGKGARATIRDSDIIHHKTGVLAEKGEISVVNCLFTENSAAIMARKDSTIRLSFVTVIHNEGGLVSLDGGKIISFKNNVVNGNSQDGAPTLSVSPL